MLGGGVFTSAQNWAHAKIFNFHGQNLSYFTHSTPPANPLKPTVSAYFMLQYRLYFQ